MSEAADKIWDFSINNPDYWELLKGEDEPPEVAEMDPDKQEAFRAARREVQRRYTELLQALWAECQTRARGSGDRNFAKKKQPKSFRAGALGDALDKNKGQVWLSIEDSREGDLRLYMSFWAAKKRQDRQKEFMGSAATDGEWLYYEQKIDPKASAATVAGGLVDKFWTELASYLNDSQPTDDAPDASTPREGDLGEISTPQVQG